MVAVHDERAERGGGMRTEMWSQRHHHFKRAMAQELMLRGSEDFGSVEDYQRFVKGLLTRLIAGRKARLAKEIAVMKELPERRLESCKRE